MKNILKPIFALFVIGQLTISCNSCEDKNTDPVPVAPPEVSTDASQADATDQATFDGSNATAGTVNNNSNSTGVASDNRSNTRSSAGSPSTMSTSVNKARDISSGTSKKRQTKSGYSAPDGSDAENHDGDPYTKHDTTPMPTGTSIR